MIAKHLLKNSSKNFVPVTTVYVVWTWTLILCMNIDVPFQCLHKYQFLQHYNSVTSVVFVMQFLQSFWLGLMFYIAVTSLSVLCNHFEVLFLWSLKGSQQYNFNNSCLEIRLSHGNGIFYRIYIFNKTCLLSDNSTFSWFLLLMFNLPFILQWMVWSYFPLKVSK